MGSTSERYYRPELDALRLLAFLFVFLFHRHDLLPISETARPVLRSVAIVGAFGVPVFFLLSAFLITELLERERERFATVHVRQFYIRRILRIWPLYYAAFFGFVLLNHFVPGTGPTDKGSMVAFTFFVGNVWITRHGWIAGSVDPLWSLSVEEQFYLVIPMLVLWGGRRLLAGVSIALLVVSAAVLANYAAHPVTGDNGQWTNSFVHFQFFAAGTLLSLGLRGRVPQWPVALRLAGLLAGFALWMVALLVFGVKSWDPHTTVAGALLGWGCVLAGAVLFFLSLLGLPEKYVPRWAIYLGRITFGLYVFHSLMYFLVFVRFVPWLDRLAHGLGVSAHRNVLGTLIALVLSIAAAHLSFQYFESPFLRLKRRFSFVPARDEDASLARG